MIPSQTLAAMATLGFSKDQAMAVAAMLREVEDATRAESPDTRTSLQKRNARYYEARKGRLKTTEIKTGATEIKTPENALNSDETILIKTPGGIPVETPSPSLPPSAPPMRDKTLPPPPSPISSPTIARKAVFDRFWRVWPHKVGRAAAEKAFAKHFEAIDEIIHGVRRYIADKPADRPWLNPATFLNGERWKDRPAAMPRAGPNVHKPEHLDPWAKAIHKAAREKNGYAEQEFSFDGLKDVTPDGDAGDVVEKHALRS